MIAQVRYYWPPFGAERWEFTVKGTFQTSVPPGHEMPARSDWQALIEQRVAPLVWLAMPGHDEDAGWLRLRVGPVDPRGYARELAWRARDSR